MIKVSVILPSLNAKNYIGKTLMSASQQTLEEIEIICVDAGSNDGTLDIIEDYQKKDSRIKLINSPVKSYGYQMNLGIKQALGQYIGILEADDYIAADMYETLYSKAIEVQADIVKSDFDMFLETEEGEELSLTYSLNRMNRMSYNEIFSPTKYIEGEYQIECYIWNAIYRKDFLVENDIWFSETPGAAYQDFGFRYKTEMLSERIVAVNKSFYRYRRDNYGSSTYNSRVIEYNYEESKWLLENFDKRNVSTAIKKTVIKEIVDYAFEPYMEFLRNGTPNSNTVEYYKKYAELFKSAKEKDLLDEEKIGHQRKIQLNLLLENPNSFLDYANVVSRIDKDYMIRLIEFYKKQRQIVIVGAGTRGAALYVLLKNNGVKSICAICDNKINRISNMDIEVVSPMDAAQKYKDAIFVISSLNNYDDMKEQLLEYHVDLERIKKYDISSHPFFCTNRMVF